MSFLEKPWVSLGLMIIIGLVLTIQTAFSLSVAKQNQNAEETAKSRVRVVSGATLAISILLILYAIVALICTYTPLHSKKACGLFSKKTIEAAVNAASETAAETAKAAESATETVKAAAT